MGEVVDLFIPTDRATGRPRGFAFVEFASSEEAVKAVEKLDGHELGGRQLRVSEAAERRPRSPRMPRGPRYGGGPPAGGGDFFESDWGGGAPRGGGGGGGGAGGGAAARIARPKGSRRNLRRKKRSL